MENSDLEVGNIDITQRSVLSLLNCVENEENHTNRFSPTICMVPRILRDLNPSCFNPRVVSIGPLHREDENVQAFEKQKARHFSNLLRQKDVGPKEEVLGLCMQKVYASMERIKACYVWKQTYDDAEIAEMMVIDACFILDFMLHVSSTRMLYSRNQLVVQNVLCDLVLQENQIPFFILDEIFQCTILKFIPDLTLIELLSPILLYHNLFKENVQTRHIANETTLHILSLLHQLYTPPDNIRQGGIMKSTMIPSAVDLDRAGVSFKPNQNPTWVMGMEVKTCNIMWFFWFCLKPTLRMPVLNIHDHTEFFLRNLIAYEHSSPTRSYITSYFVFMNNLVNTHEDVAMLVESKVLTNILGSNEEAANMINRICKEVALTSFFYAREWNTLNAYYNGSWPKHVAWLKRTYFNSPWNIIALLAGIVLFALTVVQTFFTINSAN